MGTRRKKKRKIPLGQPLPESTEEEAAVTPEDIERARLAWEKYAPTGFKNLLDATEPDNDA